MKIKVLGIGLVATMLLGSPALAHHSFAMFDQAKQLTLKGTVKDFQWTNPHSWLQITVLNASGESEDWSVEMLSPSVLGRMGWKKNSLKVGDDVTVVVSPVRNGAHGGNMISVTDRAGHQIGGPQS